MCFQLDESYDFITLSPFKVFCIFSVARTIACFTLSVSVAMIGLAILKSGKRICVLEVNPTKPWETQLQLQWLKLNHCVI